MIIFDELDYGKRLLHEGYIQPYHKRFKDIFILIKYYKYTGAEFWEAKNLIFEYVFEQDKSYGFLTGDAEREKISNILKHVYDSNRYKLRTDISVCIGLDEIHSIGTLKNINAQKIAFVLLVLSKFFEKDRIKFFKKDICALSQIFYDKSRENQILLDIQESGLISRCNQYWKLNFLNEDKVVLKINTYSDLMGEFYKLKNKYINAGNKMNCIKCGIQMERVVNNQKYCDACKKIASYYNHRISNRKWYKNKEKICRSEHSENT